MTLKKCKCQNQNRKLVFVDFFQFCHLQKISRSQSKQKTIVFIDAFEFCDLEKGPRSRTNKMVSAWKCCLVLHFSDNPVTFKSGECWQKLSWRCQIQHVIIREKFETWSGNRSEERKTNKQKIPTDHPMNTLSDRFTVAQILITPSQSLSAFESLWVNCAHLQIP